MKTTAVHSTTPGRVVSDVAWKPVADAPASSWRNAGPDFRGEPALPRRCPVLLPRADGGESTPEEQPTPARVSAPGSQAAPMARFMASSRFVVRNGMQEQVCEAFRTRPHLVDAAAGFCRMEVLRPLDAPEEFWLMTWWTDEASFATWHHGHLYRDSHAGIPKGLKLVAGSVQIRRLELIAQ